MDTKLEMIETVSKLYRDNLKYAEDLRIRKDKIKDTMQKTIADPVLDSIGNGITHAGDKIFDKGGER